MKYFYFFFLAIAAIFAETTSSITDSNSDYKKLCLLAANTEKAFSTFKRQPVYQDVVEITNYDVGYLFAKKISSQHRDLLEYLPLFNKNDLYGSPVTHEYPELGRFSPATLRYISVVGDILTHFSFSEPPKVVEIGVGYGGQCFILSSVLPCQQYTLIDLPTVLPLAKKYLSLLNVENVDFVVPSNIPVSEEYDLFISNYAFSEMSREVQLMYFHKVIQHSKRGYVLFNHISHYFKINSLSLTEFTDLLKSCDFNVTILPEEIQTASNNYLVIWD